MLYHWLYSLGYDHIIFNVFRYISFRSFIAFIVAAVFSILWGKKFIQFMQMKQFGQSIREDGPESHFKKAGTPTLGGVFIFGSSIFALIICGNFISKPFLIALMVGLSYFMLGWLDDYLKIMKKNSDGVSAKMKLVWQFSTATLACYFMIKLGIIDTSLYLPFLKEPVFDLGYFYVLFGSFVIVGSSNAVNLTDGLDGLAIGPIITSCATLGIISYLTGHKELSQYLYIPYVDGAGELTVFLGSIAGAGMGFLWYNSYPAQIFMGDVGSLSMGGILGTVAVLTKNEFLFALIGGIFVVEAVSVILQVASFKLRKKRIFKMAPIHHHFELLGWPEPKVIVRFWIISAVLSILAIATLKLR
jgi:phospho-N-acetylmuramoyl-pentapeptide-transferase